MMITPTLNTKLLLSPLLLLLSMSCSNCTLSRILILLMSNNIRCEKLFSSSKNTLATDRSWWHRFNLPSD